MGRIAASLINQHVRQIEHALSNTRLAFFELIKAIKAARDDLGDDIFQNELADKLSISPSTLSKYLQIADCDPIFKKQKSLPPTLTTLYCLVQTHSTLVKIEGADKADETFKKWLEDVNPSTEASDVAPMLKRAKEKLSKLNKQKREKKILSLSGSGTSSDTASSEVTSLTKILRANSRYRTFFIDPPAALISHACKDGVLASDIADQYPIADLRSPSMNKVLQGFVYCSANEIDGGLKILDAFGFVFRDIVVPSKAHNGFALLHNDKVLIRGERGGPTRPKLSGNFDADLLGALTIAEQIGYEPRLYVFASESYEGWTCAK